MDMNDLARMLGGGDPCQSGEPDQPKVPPTPEELAQARLNCLNDTTASRGRLIEKINGPGGIVDTLIERLQLNKGYIGGIAVVIVDIHGKPSLIHPDGESCNAMRIMRSVDAVHEAYLKELTSKLVEPKSTSSMLDALLGK